MIVYDEQCGSSAQDFVQINLFSESYAFTTDDIITCDDSSNDGIENFDLSIQNENILGGQDPNQYLVTYYETLQDAQSGENSVSTDYDFNHQHLQSLPSTHLWSFRKPSF